jgi:hypothetical protein
MYDLLFRATADTLQSIAADPQHLGAQIGSAPFAKRPGATQVTTGYFRVA